MLDTIRRTELGGCGHLMRCPTLFNVPTRMFLKPTLSKGWSRSPVLVFVCTHKTFFLLLGSIDLVSGWVVENDLFFLCEPKSSCFCVSIEIDLVLLRVVKIDLISV